MPDKYNFTIYDYDEEDSGGMLWIPELSGANFDTVVTNANAFRVALNALILSPVSMDSIRDVLSDTKSVPANPFAQREIKWLIAVEDALTGSIYNYEYPTANLNLLENNSPYLARNGAPVVTGAAVAVQAFMDALETFAVSPVGNPVSVRTIEQVGRNL